MHKTILFALVILSGLSAGALAANQVIHQQGRVSLPRASPSRRVTR
jgi:hypothetical protein